VEAFTALCQLWFQAMPANYQAHNVLGRFLEGKGRQAEALAEYKKSLQLEWNQPPISEIVNRLEKKTGP
jgi:Flp pilus assembly protein TadD